VGHGRRVSEARAKDGQGGGRTRTGGQDIVFITVIANCSSPGRRGRRRDFGTDTGEATGWDTGWDTGEDAILGADPGRRCCRRGPLWDVLKRHGADAAGAHARSARVLQKSARQVSLEGLLCGRSCRSSLWPTRPLPTNRRWIGPDPNRIPGPRPRPCTLGAAPEIVYFISNARSSQKKRT